MSRAGPVSRAASAGWLVIAKLIFIAFNKLAEIPAHVIRKRYFDSCLSVLRINKTGKNNFQAKPKLLEQKEYLKSYNSVLASLKGSWVGQNSSIDMMKSAEGSIYLMIEEKFKKTQIISDWKVQISLKCKWLYWDVWILKRCFSHLSKNPSINLNRSRLQQHFE